MGPLHLALSAVLLEPSMGSILGDQHKKVSHHCILYNSSREGANALNYQRCHSPSHYPILTLRSLYTQLLPSATVLTACSHWTSRALVASSRMRTRGSRTRARAMARRCFCPAANWLPFSPTSEESRERPNFTHMSNCDIILSRCRLCTKELPTSCS